MRPAQSRGETEIDALLLESLACTDAEISVDKNFWDEWKAEAVALSKQARAADSMQKG